MSTREAAKLLGGSMLVYTPPSEYPRLVSHWRVYGPVYHHWYAHDGYRYRGYRGHR
jgi:hypothetical protein